MQRSLLTTLILVLATVSANAQTFERTLGSFTDDRPNYIEHTNDGGYIIAGTARQPST